MVAATLQFPGASVTDSADSPNALGAPQDDPLRVPLPASQVAPQYRSSTLTPVICDDRAIARLLETILARGGLTKEELADRLGLSRQAISQYMNGRRCRPSLGWFVRLVEACGGKVILEYPR